MTDKELRKLNRTELLEMLLAQIKENEALRAEVADLTAKVEDRTLAMRDIGSIAEAALTVNGVFTAAQNAADQYLATVMEMNKGTEKRCHDMIDKTRAYCDKLQSDTFYKCNSMETDAKNRCAELLYDAQEKAKITMSSLTSALRDYYLRHEDKLRELPPDLQRLIRSPY